MMKKVLYGIFLIFSCCLVACQEESSEIIEPSAEDTFTAQSQLGNQLVRISLKDGSDDNVIAAGSCFTFRLPIEVIIDDQPVIISDNDDLQMLEDLLDDDDDLRIVYPVVLIFQDYSEVEVFDDEMLEEYIEFCQENGLDDDIECVDFEYPIEISLYDTQNQLADVITITSDEELYELLDDLGDDVLMSLTFPVKVILPGNILSEVSSQSELIGIIEDFRDDCDEEDDDFGNNDPEFLPVLTTGEWIITTFESDDTDTEDFEGWSFRFNPDGSLIATSVNRSVSGTWTVDVEGTITTLDIEIDDEEDVLDELDNDWTVSFYTTQRIDLTEDDDDDDDNDRVVFERE